MSDSKFAPGVVCQIVGVHRALEPLRGRFVTLAERRIEFGEVAWVLERHICFEVAATGVTPDGTCFLRGDKVYVDSILQRFLRPLDNPGDDEVSQERLRLPAVLDVVAREVSPC